METKYKPLSKTQKAKLSILARKGYNIKKEYGLTDLSFTDWRRVEQQEAVGCSSLTKCIQRDYKPLLAHFQSLTGQDGDAFNTQMDIIPNTRDKDDTDEKRAQIIGRIEQEIQDTRFGLGYVRAIAKNKHRTTKLEDIPKEQLLQLLMTIKKRVETDSKK